MSVSQAYQSRTIGVLGPKTTIGKVLLRKFLTNPQLAQGLTEVFIFDLKLSDPSKKYSSEEYFANDQIFAGVDSNLLKKLVHIIPIHLSGGNGK